MRRGSGGGGSAGGGANPVGSSLRGIRGSGSGSLSDSRTSTSSTSSSSGDSSSVAKSVDGSGKSDGPLSGNTLSPNATQGSPLSSPLPVPPPRTSSARSSLGSSPSPSPTLPPLTAVRSVLSAPSAVSALSSAGSSSSAAIPNHRASPLMAPPSAASPPTPSLPSTPSSSQFPPGQSLPSSPPLAAFGYAASSPSAAPVPTTASGTVESLRSPAAIDQIAARDARSFVVGSDKASGVSRAVKLERRLSPLNPFSSQHGFQAPTSVPSPKLASGVIPSSSSAQVPPGPPVLSLFGATPFASGPNGDGSNEISPLAAPARPPTSDTPSDNTPAVSTQIKRRTMTGMSTAVKLLSRSYSDADAVVVLDQSAGHPPALAGIPVAAAKAIATSNFAGHRRQSRSSINSTATDSDPDLAGPTSPTGQSPPAFSSLRIIRPRRSSVFESALFLSQNQSPSSSPLPQSPLSGLSSLSSSEQHSSPAMLSRPGASHARQMEELAAPTPLFFGMDEEARSRTVPKPTQNSGPTPLVPKYLLFLSSSTPDLPKWSKPGARSSSPPPPVAPSAPQASSAIHVPSGRRMRPMSTAVDLSAIQSEDRRPFLPSGGGSSSLSPLVV
ncbi:hypothetical protein DFJ73DRAFT_585575 [Zopfochytrium polystomum]|nr:hypothetical protein DFJ73DRAFT_585575 [Zopfochytrium polystomum]